MKGTTLLGEKKWCTFIFNEQVKFPFMVQIKYYFPSYVVVDELWNLSIYFTFNSSAESLACSLILFFIFHLVLILSEGHYLTN